VKGGSRLGGENTGGFQVSEKVDRGWLVGWGLLKRCGVHGGSLWGGGGCSVSKQSSDIEK